MKMKIVSCGDSGGDGMLVLMGSLDDVRTLREMVGMDVDVEVKPILRYQSGSRVLYCPVIGQPPLPEVMIVRDGPFMVGGTLSWKLAGKAGVVADASLLDAPTDGSRFAPARPDGELSPSARRFADSLADSHRKGG